MTASENSEGPAGVNPLCTDDMCRAFWSSKPKKYREKWATRMSTGLSAKRKFQLTVQMTEFFARQEGPMQEIAKAKRAEFQKQLESCERQIRELEQALGNARMSREQLKGAIEGVDIIFKAAAGPQKPNLTLVPPTADEPKLVMNPETPPETPDPGIA